VREVGPMAVGVAELGADSTVLPLVEIFETVEGEGTGAGYPTVFVRLFGCPLRCVWCDTKYSYPPYEAQLQLTVAEICERVARFASTRICLTGGEPLLYGARSALLLRELAALPHIVDIHVETSGAIGLAPFVEGVASPKVRYIVDYKLPDSGEEARMDLPSLALLRPQDELKFVIASRADFDVARHVLDVHRPRCTILFSPVWGSAEPSELVEWMLAERLTNVKLSLQIHKLIWDPNRRGV